VAGAGRARERRFAVRMLLLSVRLLSMGLSLSLRLGLPVPVYATGSAAWALGSIKSGGGNATTAERARRADTAAAGAIAALHAR
jgi:hypothetical protein